MKIDKFYTVVVIRLDMFESVIADERHFKTMNEAEKFKNTLASGLIGVIAEI